jgi:hypothetical protein
MKCMIIYQVDRFSRRTTGVGSVADQDTELEGSFLTTGRAYAM